MRYFRSCCFSILLSCGIFFSSASVARDVFEDLWGIATDPLKLDKSSRELSETAQRILDFSFESWKVQRTLTSKSVSSSFVRLITQAIGGTDQTIQKAIASARDLDPRSTPMPIN